MAEHSRQNGLFGDLAVSDHPDLANDLLLRPRRKRDETQEKREKLQRAADRTAQTLALLDCGAYAPTFDGKNSHTLTAKNQANLEEKAIICDGRDRPQLRNLFGRSIHHQTAAARCSGERSTFQLRVDKKPFTVPSNLKDIRL